MLEEPLRFALPLAAPIGLLGFVVSFWGLTPSVPSAPFDVQLLGPGGVQLEGTVAVRCWHGDAAPTEVLGPTDASGRLHVGASGCLAVELGAMAPGHLPVRDRQGPPLGDITLNLWVEPPVSSVDIRDQGWAGRDRPGVRLVVERSAAGVKIVGWDLLGDQPTTDRASADLWLDGEGKLLNKWKPVLGPIVTTEPGLGALPGQPWLGPTPKDLPDPSLWHAWQIDQSWSRGGRGKAGGSDWLIARDSHTAALLLQDGPPQQGEVCLDGTPGCETWTWTFAALVDASGAGRFAHGLQPRAEALLEPPSPTQQPRRVPIVQLALPGGL